MSCAPERVKITVGEDKEFKIFLREEESGNPIDLSAYNSGTVNFCNQLNEKISAVVAIPGSAPANGEISVVLTPTETSKFDHKTTDIQIELGDAGGKTRIIVLKNKVETIEQIC